MDYLTNQKLSDKQNRVMYFAVHVKKKKKKLSLFLTLIKDKILKENVSA